MDASMPDKKGAGNPGDKSARGKRLGFYKEEQERGWLCKKVYARKGACIRGRREVGYFSEDLRRKSFRKGAKGSILKSSKKNQLGGGRGEAR